MKTKLIKLLSAWLLARLPWAAAQGGCDRGVEHVAADPAGPWSSGGSWRRIRWAMCTKIREGRHETMHSRPKHINASAGWLSRHILSERSRASLMAGRKEKHTVDYFPFYVKDGRTLFILESKYGCKGTGFFTNVLRFLCLTPDHHICISRAGNADRLFSLLENALRRRVRDGHAQHHG